ncbi:MAG: methytransferase partner Trm112 [Dehalococcoidia bacterium]|nr:methytransferase partner Trm112 [Dehalococcoidia bacterium]
MKRDLMEILACPLCKGSLKLTVEEEDEKEVIKGSLYCEGCSVTYPIEETIPNLLPPELRT